MKCTTTSTLVFIILSFIYGSAFAGIAQGLKYFSPGVLITYRMLFGALTTTIIFIFRIIFQDNYWNMAKSQLTSGFNTYLWVSIAGLLFHGVPHSMIAISQQWVQSAAVQIAQPLSTTAGAFFSNLLLPDEKFDTQQLITLIVAFTGVGLTSIPSFKNSNNNTSQIALGYFLLILAVSFFGISPVVLKWKVPFIDISVCALIQTWFSFFITLIWSIIYDSLNVFLKQTFENKLISFIWPALVGISATGIASHGFVYLINSIGANGANFITFGQILVGVLIGVLILKEWNLYTLDQIILSLFGIILIGIAIGIGFYNPNSNENNNNEEEEEEFNSDENKKIIKDFNNIPEL